MPAISVWTLVTPGLKSLVHVVFDDNAVTPKRYPFAGMARSHRRYQLSSVEGSAFFAAGCRSYGCVLLGLLEGSGFFAAGCRSYGWIYVASAGALVPQFQQAEN